MIMSVGFMVCLWADLVVQSLWVGSSTYFLRICENLLMHFFCKIFETESWLIEEKLKKKLKNSKLEHGNFPKRKVHEGEVSKGWDQRKF